MSVADRYADDRGQKNIVNVSENKVTGRKLFLHSDDHENAFDITQNASIPQHLGTSPPDPQRGLCPLHTRWVHSPQTPILPPVARNSGSATGECLWLRLRLLGLVSELVGVRVRGYR